LFDPNVLIDYVNGMEAAKVEFENYTTRAISVILDSEITAQAVEILKLRRIRLSETLVWVGAQIKGLLLGACNTKDAYAFPLLSVGDRVR
jgi:predicted nucleic acid-binding protein